MVITAYKELWLFTWLNNWVCLKRIQSPFLFLSALVYGLVAIGGWLGDKVLGTKRVIMLGAIVLAIGYALVAWSGHDAGIVYMGMAAIAVGNGLFKANPSSLLSTCYEKTTRVWTVHSPCTTCPSTSALSSL